MLITGNAQIFDMQEHVSGIGIDTEGSGFLQFLLAVTA